MNKILISGAYLELLGRAMHPGQIIDGSDFAGWINYLKFQLKSEGRQELFDQIIREEIHMFESKDAFL